MTRDAVVGTLGAALMLVGVALAAVGPPTADLSTRAEVVLAFVIVGALVGLVLKLRGTAGGTGDGAPRVAWAPGAAFGSPRPEDAATAHDLSSAAVAAVVGQAATRGRELGIEIGRAHV